MPGINFSDRYCWWKERNFLFSVYCVLSACFVHQVVWLWPEYALRLEFFHTFRFLGTVFASSKPLLFGPVGFTVVNIFNSAGTWEEYHERQRGKRALSFIVFLSLTCAIQVPLPLYAQHWFVWWSRSRSYWESNPGESCAMEYVFYFLPKCRHPRSLLPHSTVK